MSKKFLDQQRVMQQTYLDIGEEMGIQKMSDYLTIVLRDPKIMGKDVFGEKRLDKVFEGLKACADEYGVCFTFEKEADYKQEELDKHQKEAWGARFQPFYERYPYIKKMRYNKPKKGWV